jgi:hypothetical protein
VAAVVGLALARLRGAERRDRLARVVALLGADVTGLWFDALRRSALMALRAFRYPFVAPLYRAVFKMTPRFGPYVRGDE